MAIETLAYKLVMDHKQFVQGTVASRKELSLAKKLMVETRTPVEKLELSMKSLDAIYKKGAIDVHTYRRAQQQLQQQLSTANNYVQGQQTAYIASQVGEAREAYGGDLDAYTDQIVATTKITNPVTGSPYTVREAYELHAGITAQKAADLRGANTTARRSSKQSVRGTQGVDATEGNGPISDSDVLSGLSKLGFE